MGSLPTGSTTEIDLKYTVEVKKNGKIETFEFECPSIEHVYIQLAEKLNGALINDRVIYEGGVIRCQSKLYSGQNIKTQLVLTIKIA